MGTNSLTVPATLESLTDIAAFVRKAAETAGLSQQATYRLRLAVDEFATNAITHGGMGAASGAIEVYAEMDDSKLTVILEDRGVPFDPRQAAAPTDLHLPAEQRRIGGLGIFLALQGVDQFAYERVGDQNRNILVVNRPSTETRRS